MTEAMMTFVGPGRRTRSRFIKDKGGGSKPNSAVMESDSSKHVAEHRCERCTQVWTICNT